MLAPVENRRVCRFLAAVLATLSILKAEMRDTAAAAAVSTDGRLE